MMIGKKDFIDAVSSVVDVMRKDIKTDLQEYVDMAIENHRRRMWVKDQWCCPEMQKFASHVWVLPNPPKREERAFGGVNLQILGHNVNYCPFCGVKV